MDPILVSGVKLMAIGMGAVFFFLTILVVCTKLMSGVVQRYFADAPDNPVSRSSAQANVHSTDAEGEVVAAIGAAIKRFRRNP